MTDNSEIYTKTMADLYLSQGHLNRAAGVYRFLLKVEPHRQDLIDGLSRIEKKLSEKALQRPVLLFSRLIDLVLKYNDLKNLSKL
jgi:RNA polymerase-interacting CarD/CdnL/TRCF family regulator